MNYSGGGGGGEGGGGGRGINIPLVAVQLPSSCWPDLSAHRLGPMPVLRALITPPRGPQTRTHRARTPDHPYPRAPALRSHRRAGRFDHPGPRRFDHPGPRRFDHPGPGASITRARALLSAAPGCFDYRRSMVGSIHCASPRYFFFFLFLDKLISIFFFKYLN